MARVQLAAGAVEVMTLHDPPIVIRNEGDIAHIARADFGPNRPHVVLGAPDGRLRDGRRPAQGGRRRARAPP